MYIRNESCSDSLNLMCSGFSFERPVKMQAPMLQSLTSGFCSLSIHQFLLKCSACSDTCDTISTAPSVSFQISGPVVSLCAAGFAGFTNCPGIKLFRNLLCKLICFCDGSLHSFCTFCQYDLCAICFEDVSSLDTHRLRHCKDDYLYPFAAAIAARPIPVFPDVGSMITDEPSALDFLFSLHLRSLLLQFYPLRFLPG